MKQSTPQLIAAIQRHLTDADTQTHADAVVALDELGKRCRCENRQGVFATIEEYGRETVYEVGRYCQRCGKTTVEQRRWKKSTAETNA